ncbi:MAG TPA: hypothetical protein VL202_09355 [Pararhizobium sp.]|uniref:hypothetical protein n=1 Tax=Pararhizobium sp. TaxID=1977563 RepID=UPI002C945C45|nr:hypothetical protein [Pararhizobium sp.]HTO31370.1 hypothetical protein [Pararhizobium sp.]
MRSFILTTAAALIATVSFVAPSQAGSDDCGPTCYIKKVRAYDYYGNLVIKKVRICD